MGVVCTSPEESEDNKSVLVLVQVPTCPLFVKVVTEGEAKWDAEVAEVAAKAATAIDS